MRVLLPLRRLPPMATPTGETTSQHPLAPSVSSHHTHIPGGRGCRRWGGRREGESGGESVDSPALEGVFENIQSNGLTVQMKQMSHRDRPLAKVTVRDMDISRLPSLTDSCCWTAGREGEEDGTPALPPGPSLVPPPDFSDDGDEVTPPQASRKPKA